MAMESMEMDSGGPSPSRRRAGTETSVPRTWLRDGGGYGTLRGISSTVLGFSETEEYIGEGAMSVESRGAYPIGRRGQGWGRAPLGCGRLVAPLRLLFGLLEGSVENKTVGFCFVQFREYFLCRISETKNSRKQELALRHLVNRLVPENASK